MKAIVKSLLVALTALLATAQRGVEFSYEGVIVDATTRYVQQAGEEYAFRPLLRALQVETVSTAEFVDKPVVVRKLTFPLHETICERTEEQTGKQCPLKRNGKSFMCNMAISQPVLESSIPQSTGITCEPMTTNQLQHKIRMRRSKAGKGSGGNKGNKGSGGNKGNKGSRPGGGSSIAGRDKGDSGTRTA
ncbi:hypothetical protein ANANG_G00174780 [Anguilla anguilla]|uniref:Cath-1 n=2 Tax=Anguilla anguilla TaxID=7936 RepID=A0A7U1BJZ2_ANGAN|nr:hypothetical protein ANANG_G00174780 [Anguilla anguilla]QQZ00861.1 cath-1 [Anguilla anguilla]